MAVNKLQPQRGAGVSCEEAGAVPQLCSLFPGHPFPCKCENISSTQNVALNPVLTPLMWKRFELNTHTGGHGGGRGWVRDLLHPLTPGEAVASPPSCFLLWSTGCPAQPSMAHANPPQPGTPIPGLGCRPGRAPSLAASPEQGGREPSGCQPGVGGSCSQRR